MTDILNLIGRSEELFCDDIMAHEDELQSIISNASFLVLGGAGSIGQAVVKEIFKRQPKVLHVVDISENNLTEVVRDIRSSYGYINGDFQTFALDIGSDIYDAFVKQNGPYDYVLNLSALKHVRSEKDPFTLMRLIDTNIFNTDKTLKQSIEGRSKAYFCVSTDKAANPVNMMGASKLIMEKFAMKRSERIRVSMARFANVAFSDGSLLHGFNQRIQKQQPIVAPTDVKRYFVTPKESGELCLMACIFGQNRDIFFPKLSESLHLISFSDIALKYLENLGYEPYFCSDEDEARRLAKELPKQKKWPCYFTKSDTTGEKDFEEFYTGSEDLDMTRFSNLGVIKNSLDYDDATLKRFETVLQALKAEGQWTKDALLKEFFEIIPDFNHLEKGKYLDAKM